jgi:hypothetical protein
MGQLQALYNEFLNIFPGFLHPFISIALALLLAYSIFQTVKQNFIWIIALIVLLPASIPILKDTLAAVIGVIKFLLP